MSDDNASQEVALPSEVDSMTSSERAVMEYEREMAAEREDGWTDVDSDEDEMSITYSELERHGAEVIIERCPSCSDNWCHHWCDDCEDYHFGGSSDSEGDDEAWRPVDTKVQSSSNKSEKAEERRVARELQRFTTEELEKQLRVTTEKLRFIEQAKEKGEIGKDDNEKTLLRKAHFLRFERTVRQDSLALHRILYEKMQQKGPSSFDVGYFPPIKAALVPSKAILIG